MFRIQEESIKEMHTEIKSLIEIIASNGRVGISTINNGLSDTIVTTTATPLAITSGNVSNDNNNIDVVSHQDPFFFDYPREKLDCPQNGIEGFKKGDHVSIWHDNSKNWYDGEITKIKEKDDKKNMTCKLFFNKENYGTYATKENYGKTWVHIPFDHNKWKGGIKYNYYYDYPRTKLDCPENGMEGLNVGDHVSIWFYDLQNWYEGAVMEKISGEKKVMVKYFLDNDLLNSYDTEENYGKTWVHIPFDEKKSFKRKNKRKR